MAKLRNMAALALAGALIAAAPAAAQNVATAAGGGARSGNGGGQQLGARVVVDRAGPPRRAQRPPRPDYGPGVLAERVVRGRAGPPRGLLDLPGGFASDRRGRTFPRGLLDLPGGFANDERGRRRRNDDDYGWYFGGGYGGYGVQEPHGYRDHGYFDQRKAELARSRSSRGAFEYDRGYPYDYYGGDREDRNEAELAMAEPVTRCRMQWTRDRRSGGQVQVRICSR